jgi:hypothetical protein
MDTEVLIRQIRKDFPTARPEGEGHGSDDRKPKHYQTPLKPIDINYAFACFATWSVGTLVFVLYVNTYYHPLVWQVLLSLKIG